MRLQSLFLLLIYRVSAMASVFVTHGGGPMPILYLEQHKEMYKQLQSISQTYKSPKAIIVFSAHWEEKQWTILDYDHPKLYYDYYGFPKQSYNLSFSAQSNAEVRTIVKEHLLKKGIDLKINKERGYDHGVFIPLMIMYPQSQIPVIQISILKSLDPEKHFRMGQSLKELVQLGFLVLGSGASIHGGFGQKQSLKYSKIFDNQLSELCLKQGSEQQLLSRVKNWKNLKYSEWNHPREEHLIPLFINLGAFTGKSKSKMTLELMGVTLSNYVFQ